MNFSLIRLAMLAATGVFVFAAMSEAATAATEGFPSTGEDLAYSVNWPSGLSLGEGHLRASHQGVAWSFELSIDASVPGFDVLDRYRASATSDFCSTSFERTSSHGARKTHETETISGGTVVRQSESGGGKSEVKAPDCVKDALTFLFFLRRELGQGRVPPAQQIVFGNLYNTTLEYVGAPIIRIAGKPEQSDKMICTMTGPASTLKFEMYFARDAARTPLLVKVPLQMGVFSMELVR